MRERLLRGVYPEQRECAHNDKASYVIKGIACVIARVFSEAISRFHNKELVAASLRMEIFILTFR
ncbi:MAG: hypothetical protein AYP45_13045 [Candidatus Brocadia carolinensis]|uniref:Uncharacterized protein n=1 Tax=Candidatus Brocadia carolinensis TaxID=1004156 RepID=A0A1V4ARI6_9BACT|nr:MAG: hypothetical protein AYP45_13045 [Candidatus Brocadia caroliniensis]